MPIIIQHQPSPAAVGVAAFVSGKNKYLDEQQKMLIPRLRQMDAQRFQWQEEQARGRQHLLLQDQQQQFLARRDAQDFRQKQDIANAEARARGEPIPFPDQTQVGGEMQGRQLPGGRQMFEGPGTTLDGGMDAGGVGVGLGGGVRPMTPFQQHQDLAAAKADADRIAKIREGLGNQTMALPPKAQGLMDTLTADRVALEADPKVPAAIKAQKRREFDERERPLLGLAQPVGKPTAEEAWNTHVRYADPKTGTLVPQGTAGAVPVQMNPKTGVYARIDLGQNAPTADAVQAAYDASKAIEGTRYQVDAKGGLHKVPTDAMTPQQITQQNTQSANAEKGYAAQAMREVKENKDWFDNQSKVWEEGDAENYGGSTTDWIWSSGSPPTRHNPESTAAKRKALVGQYVKDVVEELKQQNNWQPPLQHPAPRATPSAAGGVPSGAAPPQGQNQPTGQAPTAPQSSFRVSPDGKYVWNGSAWVPKE